MFYRGQKIIVTESSASKRHHPSTGDIGYLNNMYLFYADRFILLDAIFSSYKSDRSTEPSRCERKKLIIDLGISPRTRQKMITTGMAKKFFLNNKYVIPLTTAAYFVVANKVTNVPHMDGPDGLWNRLNNKSGKITMGTSVKIPIGNIGLASVYSSRKGYIGHSDLKAWIRSMTPFLNAHIYELPSMGITTKKLGSGQSTINHRANDLYVKLSIIFRTKDVSAGSFIQLSPNGNLNDINKKLLVDTMREFQILSFMHTNRSDDHIVSNLGVAFSSKFKNVWSTYRRWDIVDDEYTWKHAVIVSIMFRAIFTPGDVYTKMLKIKRFLPITENNLIDMCRRIQMIRKEGITSSAALARVFEEKLLKQKKLK